MTRPELPSAIEAERFRHFIGSVTDYAIYTLSPDGIVMSWNAGAERFKGYTAEQIIGQHFSRFYTEEDRTCGLPEQILQTAAAGKFEGEGWRVRRDGSRFWASVVIDPIHGDDGVLLGYTKITRDITDRLEAQRALHASEEQFRLLVQGVTDYAIYLLSPEGIVTNWNAGACRIKGYQESEVVGTHFSRFYTEEERAAALPMVALSTAAREGRFEKEGWRVRRDGTRFWAHVVIDPIRNRSGEIIGFAKITRDVTERRQAEEELARAKEALFQAQKLDAIGKLTGGIAHDFNNLLNVIINGLDILRATTDATIQGKAIDGMERAAERGASLTQQLLAFARQQPMAPKRVELNRVISSFESVLRRAIRSSIVLETSFASKLPCIIADTPQLEAALLNLVVNARDAIDGSGSIRIATGQVRGVPSGTTLPDGHYVHVAVADNGTGMSAEVAARAFEPFFTTKEIGAGTGLGLSQVYGMVQQVHGDVALASEPGKGTEVTLYFSALDVTGDQDGNAEQNEKVLVVDDQPDVLDMAVHLFSSLGYDVLSANNGGEALETLRRNPDIGILFSDVVMPGMSGVELAKSALLHLPTLKVILASGYVASALKDQGADLARFELVNKPYRLSDIIRKLKAVH